MPEDKGSPFFRLFNEIGILEQLSRAVHQARLSHGMLVSHFAVLNHLIRVEDGRTPLALARAFQVPKTTMTHTLAGLDAAGFIRMKPNAEVGRSKRVWITPAGRKFRNAAIATVTPDLDDLAGEFDEDRVAKILPELEALRKIMDRRRNRD